MYWCTNNEFGGVHINFKDQVKKIEHNTGIYSIFLSIGLFIITLVLGINENLTNVVLIGCILGFFSFFVLFGLKYWLEGEKGKLIVTIIASCLFLLAFLYITGIIIFGTEMEIIYPVKECPRNTEASGIYNNVEINQAIWPYVYSDGLYYFGHEPATKVGDKSGTWVYRELVVGDINSTSQTFVLGLALINNSTGKADEFAKFLTSNYLDGKGVENPEQVFSGFEIKLYKNTEIEVRRT